MASLGELDPPSDEPREHGDPTDRRSQADGQVVRVAFADRSAVPVGVEDPAVVHADRLALQCECEFSVLFDGVVVPV